MLLRDIGLSIDQLGVVVADLDAAIDRYRRTFALEPWHVWTYDQELLRASSYRGDPGEFSMQLALAGAGPQVELIQPLAGPSIYHEWLREVGEGLHHVGCRVESLDEGIARLQDAGYELLQMGRGYGADGDGGFAYFDGQHDHGTIIEVIEVPQRRVPPEATVPEAAARRA